MSYNKQLKREKAPIVNYHSDASIFEFNLLTVV